MGLLGTERRASSRTLDLIVWLTYTILLFGVIWNHEPWFDEAQAWLLARDSDYWNLLAHLLRYEGSPGLWHSLLSILAAVGLPYSSMNVLAGAIASAGTFVFIRYAPFPRPIRYLVPFSYFIFYQYGVIARSYVLLPLLLFLIARLYRTEPLQYPAFTLLLVALSEVSLHGFLLACAVVAAFTTRVWVRKAIMPRTERVAVCILYATFAMVSALMVLQLWPPSDLSDYGTLNFGVKHFAAVTAIKLEQAFSPSFILSFGLLAISAWWFYKRHLMMLFLAGLLLLSALAGIAYSNVWHEGLVVLWWMFVMWLSWPTDKQRVPSIVYAIWALFLSIQIYWTVAAAGYDLRFPYCGAKAVAGFISDNHLDGQRMYGYGFKTAAILPYFSHNIFANYQRDQSYWLWSKQNRANETLSPVPGERPGFVVLSVVSDSDPVLERRRSDLTRSGYHLIRRFDGALFWKSKVLERDAYDLYGRDQSLVRR